MLLAPVGAAVAEPARRFHGERSPNNRRHLELCELSYMADKLRVGDLCVSGSDAYADYRDHFSFEITPQTESRQAESRSCRSLSGRRASGLSIGHGLIRNL